MHTVIDDHSRVAYAEIHDDETAATAVGVLRRAVAWFAARGVTVERVLSDNGSAYRSHAWRDTCAELGIRPKRTRPYRPQTNGKIERFHRTLADGWAFSRHYNSRISPPKRAPSLATRLQSPQAPHRHRQGPTHHPVDQPARAVQLARSDQASKPRGIRTLMATPAVASGMASVRSPQPDSTKIAADNFESAQIFVVNSAIDATRSDTGLDEVPRLVSKAKRHHGFVWLHLVDPEEETVDRARETLGIHPVAAADVVSGRQQPKVQKFAEHLFILLWRFFRAASRVTSSWARPTCTSEMGGC